MAAIAAVIWWLEYRPGADEARLSPISGESYGPAALPAALAPPGLEVGPQVGKLAPNFLLEDLDGGELRLSDLRGQAVVLNFWATWCRPCRREVPQFVAAYDRYRDQGLVIVAVDLQEGRGTIQRFADDFGMDFPIAIDRRGDVAKKYRLLGLPTTYFIDRGGVIRSVYRGPLEGRTRGTNVQGAIEGDELGRRIREILE
jgi:peroxiredoxin